MQILYNPAQIDFDTPGKRHYSLAFHLDGAWGYSLVPLTVVRGARGDNPNGVLCFGGTHGNEYEGQVAVKRLAIDLDPEKLSGLVVLMPQLSESACVANQRTSPLDGVNMNRAFPGNPRGSLSYRISNMVKTLLFPRGNIVIDIHAGGREGAFPLCTSFHPIPDVKQRSEIAKVARLFDTPFVFIYSSTMASGLLTDEAEAEGKISLGGEFGAGESADRDGILHAYEGVLNVLRSYGMLEGEVKPIRKEKGEPILVRAAELDRYVPCPCDGIWEPLVALGEKVEAGQLLGRLHDFAKFDEPGLEVRAEHSGYVAMMHLGARPRRGQTLHVIAEPVDWSEVLA